MRNPTVLLLFFLLAILAACQTSPEPVKDRPFSMCDPGEAIEALSDTALNVPLFEGLGNQRFTVTTRSEKTQTYFEQGFKLANGFNHMEAVRSFRYAIREDSACAMCYWGLAYVLGPNYNAAFDGQMLAYVQDALAKAQRYMGESTPKEQALIRAMVKRYPASVEEEQTKYEKAFADAMGDIARQYPDDDNIQALLAEALMNLHPWDLWDGSGNPKPWTPEILGILEKVLARNPDHIPSIHFYIHATEQSSPLVAHNYSPHKALGHAERLGKLAPMAGHLVHMPSHTYIRTGDYHLGVLVNEEAVRADSVYVSACHAAGSYPLAYYPHNFHFLAACAALEGDSRLAVEASWRMVPKLDTIAMRQPGMETIQHYYSIPYYVMAKFNRWDDILALPRPARDLLYPTAIWRYARGMAFLGKGQTAQAREELADLKLLAQNQEIREYTIWYINNMGELLDIATYVLEGELLTREGKLQEAARWLAKAVEKEDQLKYNEPPDWFFSTRHHLGPVLLGLERYAEAEKTYRRDLEIFPKNGFALNGLYTALMKQGKTEEAQQVRKQFDEVWKNADVNLEASRVTL